MCGREIKNAIVKAAIKAAVNNSMPITQKDFEEAAKSIVEAAKAINKPKGKPISEEEKAKLNERIKDGLQKEHKVVSEPVA
jgi:ribosomal protein S20